MTQLQIGILAIGLLLLGAMILFPYTEYGVVTSSSFTEDAAAGTTSVSMSMNFERGFVPLWQPKREKRIYWAAVIILGVGIGAFTSAACYLARRRS